MADHAISHDTGDHGHAGHHITPQSQLITTGLTLIALMVATIAAAQLMPEPFKSNTVFMNLVALGIACYKAYLVVSIFMGVKWATKLTKLFAIGGFVWFLTLFITLTDYSSRQIEPVTGWEKQAAMGLPRDPEHEEIPVKFSH